MLRQRPGRDGAATAAILAALGSAAALNQGPPPKWQTLLPSENYTRMALAQWGGHVYVTATDCDEVQCFRGGRTAIAAIDATTGAVLNFCQLGTGNEVTASPGGVATAPVQLGEYACTVTAGGSKPMLVCYSRLPEGNGCHGRWEAAMHDLQEVDLRSDTCLSAGPQMTRPVVDGNVFGLSWQWPGKSPFLCIWRFGDKEPPPGSSTFRLLNLATFVTAPNNTMIGAPQSGNLSSAVALWQWGSAGNGTGAPRLREVDLSGGGVDGTPVGPRGGLQPAVCGIAAYFVVKDWVPPGAHPGKQSADTRHVVAMDARNGSLTWWHAFNGSDHVSIACDGRAVYVSDRAITELPQGAMMRLLADDYLAPRVSRRDWFLPGAVQLDAASISPPVLGARRDTLYVVSLAQDAQLLQCLRAEHGKVVWERRWNFTQEQARTTSFSISGVTISGTGEDAMVYIGLLDGSVAAFPDLPVASLPPSRAPTGRPSVPPTHSPTDRPSISTAQPTLYPTSAPRRYNQQHSDNAALVGTLAVGGSALVVLLLLIFGYCWQRRRGLPSNQHVMHYQFGEMLGRGTFGSVHEAWKKDCPSQKYAIKFIDCQSDPQLAIDVLHEVEVMMLAQGHRHILTPIEHFMYIDQGSANRGPGGGILIPGLPSTREYACIVMEYFPRGDMKKFIVEHFPLEEAQLMEFAMQLASALDFLHTLKKPLVHRDLKPENVLVRGRDGADGVDLVVADFGLAKLLEADIASGVSFCCTQRVGTPWTMAPEHFFRGYTGKEIDLWSLGCILYGAATGRINKHEPSVPTHTYVEVLFQRAVRVPSFQYCIFRETLVTGYSTRFAGLLASLLHPEYRRRPRAIDVSKYVRREPVSRIEQFWTPSGPAGCGAIPHSPRSDRSTPLPSPGLSDLDGSIQSPSAALLATPLFASG